MIIGTIYELDNFQDFSEFSTHSGYSISNGKILTPSDGSILRKIGASALDSYLYTFELKANGNGDFKINLNAQNGNVADVVCYFNVSETKLKSVFYQGASFETAAITYTQGDRIRIELAYEAGKSNMTVTNLENNSTASKEFPAGGAFSSSLYTRLNGQGHFLEITTDAEWEISLIKKETNEEFQPNNLLVGDSISDGSVAGSADNRFGKLAGMSIYASSSFTTFESLAWVDEIINVIQPKKVWYAMGTNDLKRNTPNWQGNYQNFVNQLEQAGIEVIATIPPMNNGYSDTSIVQSFVKSNFSKWVDLYPVLQNPDGTLNTQYDADGVHPNSLAQPLLAQEIISSSYYETNETTAINLNLYYLL